MKILLVVYDDNGFLHWFPQGIAYISAVLLKEGYEVEIYNQDVNHYPDEHLTEYLDNNKFDIVGVSVIAGYYQYKKLLNLSEAINKSKNRPTYYMLGGHGPSPEPEYFLKKTNADIICIGEGEETVVELFNAIANNQSLNNIKGIAYRNGNSFIVNERRPLIQDIDSIPFPAYHLFPIEYYRLLRMAHSNYNDFLMPILSGRGCTFKCNFCYRMDKGFRARSNEGIIEEIKLLKKDYRINYIVFGDELLMSSKDRTISLCEDFIKEDLNIKWNCNGRLNYATPEVLKVMKKSGCVFINYGIEAMDDQILKNMNKALTTDMIIKGIEATLATGISPGFNIIFGNIGENKETLKKGVDFLLKYDDHSQLRTIRPVTPYPGCDLYYYAIKKGLLKDIEDFYEKKHLNSDLLTINFTEMSDEEFHMALFEANKTLLMKYYNDILNKSIKIAENLYCENDVNFRGFRHN